MDNVEINVTAGKGGNGVISFWREKFQPFGGPDGGDGGNGGNVYLKACSGEQDLSPFRNRKNFKAENGKNGEKQKKHGRDGEDLYIYVPVGTTVLKKEGDTALPLADLRKEGEEALVAKGGKGGLGNVHFASSTKKAPREATGGRLGEVVKLILEYRLMADMCIIGLTNSGKSSLLSRLTGTAPRIADYPFTTIEPVMGKATMGFNSFTAVEMPALMDESHLGRGLGNRFLKHCYRARLLLLVLDGSSSSPVDDLALLRRELEEYDASLLKKRMLVVVNKMDVESAADRRQDINNKLNGSGLKAFYVSAKTGEGVDSLVSAMFSLLQEVHASNEQQETPEFVFRPKPVTRRKK
jgi:GTP-binding protein